MDHFVEFEDVCKYYQTGSVKIAAADHMIFFVDKGECCIIVGPAGDRIILKATPADFEKFK